MQRIMVGRHGHRVARSGATLMDGWWEDAPQVAADDQERVGSPRIGSRRAPRPHSIPSLFDSRHILGVAGASPEYGGRPAAGGWAGGGRGAATVRVPCLGAPQVANQRSLPGRCGGDGMAPFNYRSPPKELYGPFPFWQEEIYFFASQHKFFFGPRDRIFARFFAGMLRMMRSPSAPNFIIFGHP